jgi:competence protein ComEA
MPRALTAAGKPSDNASPEFLEKHPLNLNSANAAQLEALPGVGPAMAQKILDYRKQNGGFKSVDQLEEVPGIGPKKMETLRPLVDVN